jgi:hypothetical protein
MATNRNEPYPLRDVIALAIKKDAAPSWAVYMGTQRHGEYKTQAGAEIAAQELAHKRGVDAWVQIDFGKYKRLV